MRVFGPVLAVVCFCTVSIAAPTPERAQPATARAITVDCDAGGDLAVAMEKARRAGMRNVFIRGTCVGNFRIDKTPLSLRGVSPEESAIVGAAFGPAVEITAGGGSVIDKLSISGENVGIEAKGDQVAVSIIDCRIHDNIVGVILDGGADSYIASTEVHDNQVGIQLDHGAESSVVASIVRDNASHGLIARANSYLAISDSEIRGHGQVGILAAQTSWVAAAGCRFADNGEIHAFASDRSKLIVRSDSSVGSAGDPTLFSVAADDVSRLQVNDNVDLHGDMIGSKSSYVTLSTSALHGSMELYGFSTAGLFLSGVDGDVTCLKGADAYCDFGATATTSGCASAPAVCGAVRTQGPSDSKEETERQRRFADWARPE